MSGSRATGIPTGAGIDGTMATGRACRTRARIGSHPITRKAATFLVTGKALVASSSTIIAGTERGSVTNAASRVATGTIGAIATTADVIATTAGKCVGQFASSLCMIRGTRCE